MTIEEASQLVIQSAFLAQGGETFLLDMGKPVKILDLAKQMIYLTGHTIKDENNLNGDIEIIKIGLRPGEKLYEELLISGESLPTKHPLIFIDKDDFQNLENNNVRNKLQLLESLIQNFEDENKILNCLSELVPDWHKLNY